MWEVNCVKVSSEVILGARCLDSDWILFRSIVFSGFIGGNEGIGGDGNVIICGRKSVLVL